ncbi:MAG: response regulator [Dehalococcoidales bacterium]
MRRKNLRVILASESPMVRHFLREVIEEEPGTVVVGQAENTTKALSLARKLRPDFALIDSYLPHIIGLKAIPLSRAGGLDTAQVISEEIPNARVLLVTNMDAETSPEDNLGLYRTASFSRSERKAHVPFKLRELYRDKAQPQRLIFTNVEMKPWIAFGQRGTDVYSITMFIGGFCFLAGLGLIATMFLAKVGAYLALAGGSALFFGVAGKLVSSLWSKTASGGVKNNGNK